MVRRIGFGNEERSSTPSVQRRGVATTAPVPIAVGAKPARPAQKSTSPWGAEKRVARDRERAAQTTSSAADAPSVGGLSTGKLVVLAFLWVILIRWSLASYGGVEMAIATIRAALDGYIEPMSALFPAIMPLVVGLFVTSLILGRKKKKR